MNVTTTSATSTVGGPAGTHLQTNGKSSVYGLGKDDFMKLFLAQLENQDPAQPMDNSQMLGEMAQFTMIDTLQQVATALAGTQLSQASALIGKHIDGVDADGKAVSGIVGRIVQSADAGLVLMVGDQAVKPDGVQTVTDAGAASGPASATDPASASDPGSATDPNAATDPATDPSSDPTTNPSASDPAA